MPHSTRWRRLLAQGGRDVSIEDVKGLRRALAVDVVQVPQPRMADPFVRAVTPEPLLRRRIDGRARPGEQPDKIAFEEGPVVFRSRLVRNRHPEDLHCSDVSGNTLLKRALSRPHVSRGVLSFTP